LDLNLSLIDDDENLAPDIKEQCHFVIKKVDA
jgi:hypothetical protein